MSPAVARESQGSIFDLDYISGSGFPHNAEAVDRFLERLQAWNELDTLTGSIPDLNLDKLSMEEYAEAISEWRDRSDADPLLDAMKKFRAGKAQDRVAPRSSFEPLQEWEGYVVSGDQSEFVARLVDITSTRQVETEQATFSMDDVSNDERHLVQPGAVFRWSLGYERRVSGTRCKVSSLVFRRLPIWSKSEIDASRSKASELIKSINWE